MKRYRNRDTGRTSDAVRWKRHGDHPAVWNLSRARAMIEDVGLMGHCDQCGRGWGPEAHGYLYGVYVCPGDWIVNGEASYTEADFRRKFKKIES